MALKVKDTVLVISGKDRLRKAQGTILSIDRKKSRAIVEGVNMVKKHARANPRKGVKGGIIEREAAIHLSNLMLICPGCGKPTRVGSQVLEDGRRVRTCKRSGCGHQLG